MSKTPTLFLTTLPVEGDGRERARGRQFSREKSGKSRSTRRRCGRSSADTFERVPVVGAEMGGHGEARLAGPDTAISGARGIETVAQSFARLEFFQVSRLLFAPPRCFRFQAADRARVAAGVGEREKIASIRP